MTSKSFASVARSAWLSLGALAAVALAPHPATAGTLSYVDFTGAAPLTNWLFYNGPEFPGATGSLAVQADPNGNYAQLSYTITCSATNTCGHYVSANWATKPYIAVPTTGGVVFQVSPDMATVLQLRVIDSTGQTLQYPISVFSIEKPVPGVFYKIVLPLSQKPQSYFGGANNGIFSGSIKGLQIVAKPAMANTPASGSVKIKSIAIVDNTATTEDLGGLTPAATALSVNFPDFLGVVPHDHSATALTLAKAAGFGILRNNIDWQSTETAPGYYDFTNANALMANAKAYGFRMLWILDYGNTNYGGYPSSSAAITAFAKFAKAAAQNFNSAVPPCRYEIWNEPENWYLSVSNFIALSQAAANAIHSVNPNTRVVTGGTLNQSYYSTALKTSSPAYAAVGMHLYTTQNPESLGQLVSSFANYGSTPVWDTESGYATIGFFDPTLYGSGTDPRARKRQAVLDVRRVLSEWALGLPLITIYDLSDDGPDTTRQINDYGLLDYSLNPKPAYYAIQTLTQTAGSTGQARLLLGLPADLHAIAIRTDANGQPFAPGSAVVVWDEVPGASHTITFSGHTLVKATDMLGNVIAQPGATSVPVSEVGGPIYLFF